MSDTSDPTLGDKVDTAVAQVRTELNARIDELQARIEELSARVDAAQGQ